MTPRMRERIKQAVQAIEQAEQEERKHLSLTDPDARMMTEGRDKKIRECHSFEAATDQGLLVVGQATQEGTDNHRLEAILAAAREQEPDGVFAVDADSGYYSSDAIARLIASGIDTCVPTNTTACDLHRGLSIGTTLRLRLSPVPLQYQKESDSYSCPEGNVLHRQQSRHQHGQQCTVYRAERDCTGCPLAAVCLTQRGAKRRTLKVGEHHELLTADQQRFTDKAHQERYHHRGEQIETVFGFLRGSLGYARWLLRGSVRVGCEARLFKMAYQIRKVHTLFSRHDGLGGRKGIVTAAA